MREQEQRTRRTLGIVMTALMLAIFVFAGGVTADLLGIKDIWTMRVNAAEAITYKTVDNLKYAVISSLSEDETSYDMSEMVIGDSIPKTVSTMRIDLKEGQYISGVQGYTVGSSTTAITDTKATRVTGVTWQKYDEESETYKTTTETVFTKGKYRCLLTIRSGVYLSKESLGQQTYGGAFSDSCSLTVDGQSWDIYQAPQIIKSETMTVSEESVGKPKTNTVTVTYDYPESEIVFSRDFYPLAEVYFNADSESSVWGEIENGKYITQGYDGKTIPTSITFTPKSTYNSGLGTSIPNFQVESSRFCWFTEDHWNIVDGTGSASNNQFYENGKYKYEVKLRPKGKHVKIGDDFNKLYVYESPDGSSRNQVALTRRTTADSYTDSKDTEDTLTFYYEFKASACPYWDDITTQGYINKYIRIDESTFPDQTSRSFVNDKYGESDLLGIDTGRNTKEMEINLNTYPLKDLTFLKYFPYLKELTLSYGSYYSSKSNDVTLDASYLSSLLYLTDFEVTCNSFEYGSLTFSKLSLPKSVKNVIIRGSTNNSYFPHLNRH